MASNYSTIQDDSLEYDDWIEIGNPDKISINLNGWYISDDLNKPRKYQFSEDIIIPGSGFTILWADNDTLQGPNHLNFKLKAEGEEILITAPDGETTIDYIQFNQQRSDVSFGRYPDFSGNFGFMTHPTPSSSNTSFDNTSVAESPSFNYPGGFYDDQITITISTNDPNTEIRYTLNGNEPTLRSELYSYPFQINQTSIIRTRAFRIDQNPSPIVTNTYIINLEGKAYFLPVVSLATDSSHLWGNSGIYTRFTKGWEKPVHVEFFNSDGQLCFSQNCGIKIHAPDYRDQKSFRIYARLKYGKSEINYPIFKDKPDIDSFKCLVLRNAANDGIQKIKEGRTHFRDGLLNTLYLQIADDNGMSSFLSVNVLLNGEYWGIYNLRERQDSDYTSANFGFSEVDLLERCFGYTGNRNAIDGDWEHFDYVKSLVEGMDLSINENYQHIKTLLDVEDYLEYCLFEIYSGNFDWLSNNVKFWRPRIPGGKWRWLLWDLDHGFGLPYTTEGFNCGDPSWNTLEYMTGTTGTRTWYGSNTEIIRNLLENSEAKNFFINRMADILNTNLKSLCVQNVIDSMAQSMRMDMPKHIKKWECDKEDWDHSVLQMKNYAAARPDYVRQHLIDKFDLGSKQTIYLNVQPTDAGFIKLNTIQIQAFPWSGDYFEILPIHLTAVPFNGYRFTHWDGLDNRSRKTELYPSSNNIFIASFEIDTSTNRSIVINEINYNSSDAMNPGDWIELYNNADITADISNWKFEDENSNSFAIPEYTFIYPDDYIILCREKYDFQLYFPGVENVIGDFGFNLNKDGELIKLIDTEDKIVDSVRYENNSPWPLECDGNGPTLALIDPDSDNTIPENWQSSDNFGSPGKSNNVVYNTSVQMTSQVTEDFKLFQNYPNPFNSSTQITFSISKKQHVKIQVYDILGKLRKVLSDQIFNPGHHTLLWKGLDDSGNPVGSGIYLYQIRTERYVTNRRMVYLK